MRAVQCAGRNLGDGLRAEGTDGRRDGQKHVRGRDVGAGAFPIDEESIAYFLWQGKACGALRLAYHAERGVVPVNIAHRSAATSPARSPKRARSTRTA